MRHDRYSYPPIDDDVPDLAPPHPFVGWVRAPDGTWREVCSGPDYGECWGELLNAATSKHSERQVLARGVHPNDRPSTTRRRSR